MKRLATFFLSAGGAGYIPVAPGTWGTLVGVILIYCGSLMGMTHSWWPLVLSTIIVSVIAHRLIAYLPETWEHDDGRIVIDEVIGIFVTLWLLPITPLSLGCGFILFRIFDIWKPLGIRRLDAWRTDWGVIADDILAGIYAHAALRAILYFWQ